MTGSRFVVANPNTFGQNNLFLLGMVLGAIAPLLFLAFG